jgi:MFS family permease
MLAYAWLAPTIRLIQDCAEPHQRALAIALCGAIGMFVGLGLGLPLIGWISDLITPSYGARAIGLALCFVVSAAIVISLVSHEIVLSRLKIAQAGEGRI